MGLNQLIKLQFYLDRFSRRIYKNSPDEDVISSGLISKKLLFSKIEIALAGRAAETLVFGESKLHNAP